MAAYVYILASDRHGTLYTGVTSDLARRLHQHREHVLDGFTSKYAVTRLVWFVQGDDITAAIALEKKIKNRGRRWKVDLIEKCNPAWHDLSVDWGGTELAKVVIPRAVAESTVAREGPIDGPKSAHGPHPGVARVNSPTFRIADPVADRAALIALNVEHVTWVFSEMDKAWGLTAREALGCEPAEYVPTVIDKVCGDAPPVGVFYLVEQDGAVLAMGGLRRSDEGVAEMKRVFVRPAGRGRGLGAAIARRLVDDARAFGYRQIRLDTLPFMDAAQALYESLGFVDCAPYPIEMPEPFRAHIRYMALDL